ncbi:EF-P lysine aminoacylase GenX [Candidatus Gottesmanbacteria bacterium RIFCSPLOWO2_01_FULL_39_12b]|uniref:EF-P lysine aminoacylase GenX n=1 Tax=Candidatus Gottesmanbacteria bacterium RIFCSPLOWO2_01_FULL_39_12b TaxID=1798388 RepID=A0A1F6AQD1_9BACT|nr:MAG: EF-P lysine aminoacylase GenX [Candidatus Gottesmanbacteria bacterium RIFCSPLOWO2_01_FULL_39_12b]
MSNLINNLILREKIIDAVREYFKLEKFHEVETPLLVPSVIPESYLENFTTILFDRRRRRKKMFLTASPESSLKKIIVAGLGNCFEITRSFRNGETDSLLHSPEFTILEWYRVGADYKEIMKDCENLFNKISINLGINNSNISYGNTKIDLAPPWEKITVSKALKKYAMVDFDDITGINSLKRIKKIATDKGYNVSKNNTWEVTFNQIFLNEVEPHLGTNGRPTIIYDYPAILAALAKLKKDDPRLAQRFELYIAGLELGDCYTELTDWKEQNYRFKNELKLIRKSNKNKVVQDDTLIKALKRGLPDCSGMAMGIDRVVMLFGDIKDIKDTKFTFS